MRLVPIHDDFSEESPLMPEAAEIGVRALASALGVEIGEEAVVLYRPRVAFGHHPLAQLHAGARLGETWLADEEAIERALEAISDAELEAFGVRREPSFERDAARLIRRRLAHLDADAIRELVGLLPRLHEMALNSDPPDYP